MFIFAVKSNPFAFHCVKTRNQKTGISRTKPKSLISVWFVQLCIVIGSHHSSRFNSIITKWNKHNEMQYKCIKCICCRAKSISFRQFLHAKLLKLLMPIFICTYMYNPWKGMWASGFRCGSLFGELWSFFAIKSFTHFAINIWNN